MAKKEQDLLKKILWFDRRFTFDIDFFELLQPNRIVSNKPQYKSGVFYSEKCRREIQYESGKELAFIQWLEENPKVIFYYEQPVQIKFRIGRRHQKYTPDFGVLLDTNEFFIVEIKELSAMLEYKVGKKMEGLLSFCWNHGFGLLLTDGKDTIDKIKKIKVNKDLEKEVLASIKVNGIVLKTAYSPLLKKHNATHNDLLKIIMKNNLRYYSRPVRIQCGNKNRIFRQVFIENQKYDDLIMGSLQVTGK